MYSHSCKNGETRSWSYIWRCLNYLDNWPISTLPSMLDRGLQLLVIVAIFLGLSLITVGLRCFVHLYLIRCSGMDDALSVVSLVCLPLPSFLSPLTFMGNQWLGECFLISSQVFFIISSVAIFIAVGIGAFDHVWTDIQPDVLRVGLKVNATFYSPISVQFKLTDIF